MQLTYGLDACRWSEFLNTNWFYQSAASSNVRFGPSGAILFALPDWQDIAESGQPSNPRSGHSHRPYEREQHGHKNSEEAVHHGP